MSFETRWKIAKITRSIRSYVYKKRDEFFLFGLLAVVWAVVLYAYLDALDKYTK